MINEFEILEHHLQVKQEDFKYLEQVSQQALKDIDNKLFQLANKMSDVSPLKAYYQVIHERLLLGASIEKTNNWQFVTHHTDFKLIMDFIKATHEKKSSSVTDMKQRFAIDKAIENLCHSPYTDETMRPFWETVFSEYLMRSSRWSEKRHTLPKLIMISKLIEKVGSEDQVSAFKNIGNNDHKPHRKISDRFVKGIENKKDKFKRIVKNTYQDTLFSHKREKLTIEYAPTNKLNYKKNYFSK